MTPLHPSRSTHGSPFVAVAASLLRTGGRNNISQVRQHLLVWRVAAIRSELLESLDAQRLEEHRREPRLDDRFGVLEWSGSSGGISSTPESGRHLGVTRRGGVSAERTEALGAAPVIIEIDVDREALAQLILDESKIVSQEPRRPEHAERSRRVHRITDVACERERGLERLLRLMKVSGSEGSDPYVIRRVDDR